MFSLAFIVFFKATNIT